MQNPLKNIVIDNWRDAWKFYSMWFFLALGLLPEIVALAAEMGLISADNSEIPGLVTNIIRWVAFLGAVSRMLKQIKPQWPQPTPDAS